MSFSKAERLRSCCCARVVVAKSRTALQAENRTFLLGFSSSEINPLTVSQSDAISSLRSSEAREAAPMISATRRAIWEFVEARRDGSRARMGESEDWERRREGWSLNKHLLMKGREWGWWRLERDDSSRAKMPLTSES